MKCNITSTHFAALIDYNKMHSNSGEYEFKLNSIQRERNSAIALEYEKMFHPLVFGLIAIYYSILYKII